MNELIKIGNQEITIKEYKGRRVVTFSDIDLVHERPSGTAGRNFRENKDKFIKGEDYYIISGNELRRLKQTTNFVGSNAKEIVLITEQGYLMLVKSFTDELAWDVQRKLVNTYFRAKKPMTAIELMELQFQAIKEIDNKVDEVNKDLQTFKMDLPILGIECDKITTAVKKKGVRCLGGKDSNAYKDSSLRARVYSDIYGQLKREFGVSSYKAIKRSQTDYAIQVIEAYELPMALKDEIEDVNAQINILEELYKG